jgi:putative two-component system response regulator
MSQKKILIVDDEVQIRTLLAETLGDQYEVLIARSGEEAIRMAVLDRPSCILLDVMMPQMGGFMLCEILKSLKQTRLIPILLVSAKPRDEVWPLAQELGAFDYLEKPFSVDEIREKVERTLAEAPTERRRVPRVRMRIPIIIRGRLNDEDFEIQSETEDVSRFGALVRLPFKIPVGEDIELHQAASSPKQSQVVPTKARVVWTVESGELGPYHHGLEFLTPSAQWVINQ